MMGIAQLVTIINDGGKVSLAIQFPSKIKALVGPFLDIITRVKDQLKVDQSVEVSLRLGARPADTLKEGAEPLLMELLKGISLEVRLNLWKKLADVVLKLVEAGELDPSLLPILGGVAPAFLLRVSGNLDITIDEYMKKKIAENPLVEPVLLDAKTLIDSVSGKSFEREEEF